MWFPAKVAFGSPQGASVLNGDVNITSLPANNLTLIEASHNSIINYQSFNIAGHETVQFIQPSASSRVFNRVIGAGATHIDGSLLANGQVYIVNAAGIFFGENAIVDVAGLHAAAGVLSNEDFLSGNDKFTQLTGMVLNEGAINAQSVHLFGKHVANAGSIVAPQGTVILAAGEEIFLGEPGSHVFAKIEGTTLSEDFLTGVENSGLILAEGGFVILGAADIYSVALRHSGEIEGQDIHLEGYGAALVEVSGSLAASEGGTISITGEKVGLYGAEILARGGGSVFIGGNEKGQGPLRNASYTYVDSASNIDASASDYGDGGEVVVWADLWTRFDGSIRADGGAYSGDGGFVEISGKDSLYYHGEVFLDATHGQQGTLLFDPANITIHDGGSENDDGDSAKTP